MQIGKQTYLSKIIFGKKVQGHFKNQSGTVGRPKNIMHVNT